MKKMICTLIALAMIVGLFSVTALAGSGNGKGSPGNLTDITLAKNGNNSQIEGARKQLKLEHKNKEKRINLVKQIAKLRKAYGDNTIPVFVDGVEAAFDVPPVIRSGRTLMPLRGLANSLDAVVTWDPVEMTVTVTKAVYDATGSTSTLMTLVINIGNNIILLNNVEVKIDVPAILISNRTFVPIRFIAELFGKKVDWDKETGSVIIDDDDEDDNDVDEVTPTPTVTPIPTPTPTPTPTLTPTPTPELSPSPTQ